MRESVQWPVAVRHDVARRLMQRVRVNHATGCWEWSGGFRHGGYGVMQVMGRLHSTHRLSYCAFVAPIPEGFIVHHQCNNPSCMNPAHLECTTQAWNVRHSTSTPFTVEEVREIRRRAASGESYASIGRDKCVTDRGIAAIVQRKTWKEVA